MDQNLPPILRNDYSKGQCQVTVKVHGVLFVLPRVVRILHAHSNFAGPSSRDSGEVVTPFVQVGTYPTRKFRYLRDRYSYGRRLLGLQFEGVSRGTNLSS